MSDCRNKAFVLSRPSDMAMAVMSRAMLRSQGWDAVIAVDGRETDQRGDDLIAWDYAGKKGMLGVACAVGIADMILANSNPGDIVAKLDCDIRMTESGNAWMIAATERARGIRLPPREWGGFWSCPRAALVAARAKLLSARDCDCPESNLFLSAFKHTGGQDFHPMLVSWPWIPPREIPANVGAITLPSRCSMPRRECGEFLFSQGVTP